jgi:predicted permease
VLSGLAFGLAPALHASRVDVNDGLRDSSPAVARGRGHARRALIVAELSLSIVLLVGFGLLIRSFLELQRTSAGFSPERLLETASDGGREFAPAVAFWRVALEQARSVPGVESAAVTSRPPVHGSRQQAFTIAGQVPPGDPPRAGDILVSADYFRTMGIPIVQGRAFTETDSAPAPPVIIVSQSFARRHFPGGDAIGKRVSLHERAPMTCCSAAGPVENVWREIVGVAGDIRQGNLDEAPATTFYRPFSQIVEHDMYLMARVHPAADAGRVSIDLKSRLTAVDPARPWDDVRPMSQVIRESESIRLRRFVLILLGTFAGLALVLAGVGLYGVMAYFVAERRREIGIRVALGATRPIVIKQVLSEAARLAAGGVLLGCLAARLLTRVLEALLFGVSRGDVLTYAGVSILLASVALLASYVPARRAARVDPVVALRDQL